MYMTRQRPDQAAFAVDTCASALGVDEFILLSRIQLGEINAVRASLGGNQDSRERDGAIGPRVTARGSAGNHAVAKVVRPEHGHRVKPGTPTQRDQADTLPSPRSPEILDGRRN